MEIYTLDKLFQKSKAVEEYESVIWTERYSAPGDFELVVPAKPLMVDRLKIGTRLWTPESREAMTVETVEAKGGKLTVKGRSMLAFLEQRIFRTTWDHGVRSVNVSGAFPAEILIQLFTAAVVSPPLEENLADRVPEMGIGAIDINGGPVTAAIQFGPVLERMLAVAQTYSLGLSLYLIDTTTPSLEYLLFTVYRGRDLTKNQEDYKAVQFRSADGTLTDVEEVRSDVNYKNTCIAAATSIPPEGFSAPSVTYNWPMTGGVFLPPTGLERRVMQIEESDITLEVAGGSGAILLQMLAERARNALANNNFVRVVDGEVIPQPYTYGVDYKLGDIIELIGDLDVNPVYARITEFIRSKDSSGSRAYPTVSVLD